MPSTDPQMRKGTTTIVILKLLAGSEEPLHGYQIIRELEKRSDGYFQFKEGLIYPRLHQMERDGLLKSEWQNKPNTRRRKVYQLTEAGHRQLKAQLAEWQKFSATLDKMLGNV